METKSGIKMTEPGWGCTIAALLFVLPSGAKSGMNASDRARLRLVSMLHPGPGLERFQRNDQTNILLTGAPLTDADLDWISNHAECKKSWGTEPGNFAGPDRSR